MAEANISGPHDQFSCSVCLDLFNDPVTLLCGHSFCMVCINKCWDQEDQQGVCSCPQCREHFSPRPAVSKNIFLAEVVETLRRTQAKRPAECSVGPEDRVRFKKHKLAEASSRLQEQICSQHNKLLVYCCTDQRCICMSCNMDEHKGHDTVSVTEGRAEKQKQMLDVQRKFQQKLKEREKELQELTNAVASHKHSAQAAVQETERIFTNLIKSINKRCSEVTALIRAQENTAVSRAEKIIKKLEQEIAELKRRDAEMEKLSHEVDHIHFLQSFQPVVTPVSTELPAIIINSFFSFEDAVKSVSQLQKKLKVCSKEQLQIISTEVNKVLILPSHYREEFLQYSCHLKLDPNTAYKYLQLSDSNRRADYLGVNMYSRLYEHADRFESHAQVLCSESVCKPSYWEVEWNWLNGVSIAVSYKDISRKGSGDQCVFGRNEESWSLWCKSSGYTFLHNNRETKIPVKSSSSKIGVFVDYEAGNLSFYNVSNTMTLIHKVNTTFTQPLYPGFWVNDRSYVQLCN